MNFILRNIPFALAMCVTTIAAAQNSQDQTGDFGGVSPGTLSAQTHGSHLILVKEFSTEKVEVVGAKDPYDKEASAKKKNRIRRVLAERIQARLLRHGFNSASYKSNSTTKGTLVVDGEFTRIYKKKPRMSIRFWVYHSDNPNVKIFQRETDARSTAGPVSMASVAMNNLAHKVIDQLKVNLPPILVEMREKKE